MMKKVVLLGEKQMWNQRKINLHYKKDKEYTRQCVKSICSQIKKEDYFEKIIAKDENEIELELNKNDDVFNTYFKRYLFIDWVSNIALKL